MKRFVFLILIALAVGGCRYAHVDQLENKSDYPITDILDFRKEMRLAYIEMCKQKAQRDHGDYEGWAADCMWEFKGEYKIVYTDAKYLSFYVEAYVLAGYNAHGGTSITVGTIDRKTGRVLKATDLIPEKRMAEVQAALYDGAATAVGGNNNLQGEVKVIDNCYLDEEGIHFIYNEYKIAPYAMGPIEVVIELPENASLPVTLKRAKSRPLYE